ncbi:Tripeptidyl-peptidase 1 [Phytophthora nicotianae]|uniref:Tripeptidyl-peptidase 1 n=1 Tax=Phytophthora nicotianae TaxID=4792 RepID=A0A0W8D9B9_PHYNI|nr:Tripeptidyl-peptidase 1 [Phytophthora nicotianae]
MVYTIVCHLYAKEGKDVEEKIRSKLVEASNVYVKDAGTLNWHVMQDHADPRKWTIVERYEKKSHILHFSDVHLNISESLDATEPVEMQFKYGNDAPITMLKSAVEFAKKLMPDPDFFLYTGDHVVHGDLTDKFLADTIETNVKTVARYYSTKDNDTNLDITALLGNADTTPDYTMNLTDPEAETNPSITLISAAWEDILSTSNLDWFNHSGYRVYDLDENLAVLTLNTFFAHVHSIEFRIPLTSEQLVQEETEGTELVPLFMSAAISPIYNNNPEFMIWDFDANSYEVLDFTVYGTNISSDSQEVDWKPLFKASTAYGVNSLRTTELNALVSRLASDSALLEQYYYNSKVQSYLQSPCVDVACQSKWLCTTQWYTTSEDFEACAKELEMKRSA